jgi:prepilin-type N-terminal cleavage/methylation domain-containing protein
MKNRGFTLIELLIVIAIIAILALIATPNFLEAQTRSKVARAHADMRSIAGAVESYAVDYNTLPLDADDYSDGNPMLLAMRYNQKRQFAILTTPVAYMTGIPSDPFHTVNHAPDDMTNMLFSGEPPQPFAYLTIGAHPNFGPITYQPSNDGRPTRYGIISLGPNRIFDSASRGGINDMYDPTNGTTSRGDVIRYGPGMPTEQ